MRGSYQTKQRKQVWDYLAEHPDQSLSTKEIHSVFQQNDAPVGLATIYRHLEQLTQDGKAKKVVTNDGAGIRFQYVPEATTPEVFYLKCDRCGTLTQMDCELLYEVADHMNEKHGFQLDTTKSVLYGRCQSCKP